MTTVRSFGRLPTLGEMREYYAREDVLSFLYDESRMRNIDIAFRKKRWPINPISKADLREIIHKTIENRIERAYKGSAGSIDSVRLEKFDYLSFHFRTSIISGEKLIGFDTIFEADMQGWRRAFEDLCGVVKLLDDFGVCYRMKYSGVRSLHFMIPFEAFPKQFRGKPVLSQRTEIQSKIGDYFRRHCGMEKAHGGSVMRLAYSLNEDNGLVSLPILSDELSYFRPWEANIYNIAVDKPWHGDIPTDANRKMLRFLREVYNEDARARKSRRVLQYAPTCLEIVPKDRSSYAAESDGRSMEEWAAQLRSNAEADRIKAAWNLMIVPEPVPISILEAGLSDENPDVRWYLTESLQEHQSAEAAKLAGKMLWDDDQFVRISAVDALVLSDENTLQTVSDSLSGSAIASMGAFSDVTYAIQKIFPEGESEAIRSFAESNSSFITHFLRTAISSNLPLWRVGQYVRQLRELCKRYGIVESVLFRDAIETLVPQLLMSLSKGDLEYQKYWVLREIRRNQAIPLMVMREMADSLGIDTVKIPSNRMEEEERTFLTQVVRGSLDGMTLEQKARILHTFWRCSGKKLSEPAGKLLMCIKHKYPSVAESVTEWTEWMDTATPRPIGVNTELLQEKSVDELIGMLEQGWRVRIAAAYALAEKCNTDEDIDKVIGALQRKNTKTKARTAAVMALGGMSHHRRAREAIAGALNAQGRTKNNRPFPRWDVRRAALKIYVRSNPPDAVDVLLRAVEEWRSATARYDAVSQLGRYMDDERVPSKLREVVADQLFPLRARLRAERLLQRVQE